MSLYVSVLTFLQSIKLPRHLNCVVYTHSHSIVRSKCNDFNCLGGIILLVALLSPLFVHANEKDTLKKKTNCEVMQELVDTLTLQIMDQSHITSGDTIRVRLKPQEDGWIAQTSIMNSLKAKGYTLLTGDSTLLHGHFIFDVLASDLQVRYDNMFHDGFLGSKKVRRTVTTKLVYQMINIPTGEVLRSDSPTTQFIDTVLVDDIAALELSSAKSTHNPLPSDTFIDKVIEPFVIIGATGVAVYLFFHVRS